jgi:putative ABC transport system substrate-binding protein
MRLLTIGRIVIVGLALLLAPLATAAQQPMKVYRIGVLAAGRPGSTSQGFQQELHELGYVEGQNLVLESRYAEGNLERLHDLAAELVQRKVDVIVAGGAPVTRAAQHATRTIPIVMMGSPDPVGEGFVASLARPGGNITGVSHVRTELIGKQLELLKEMVPQSTRIAVLANPAQPAYPALLHKLTEAARTLGLRLHAVELRSAAELDTAFAAMIQVGADALVVLDEVQLIGSLRGRIVDLAAKRQLPAMYNWKEWVGLGGLMSYGPSQRGNDRLVAVYVDKIFKGAKPADLPVEQPTKFELVLNIRTAKALGITIPPTLLFQADEVIR